VSTDQFQFSLLFGSFLVAVSAIVVNKLTGAPAKLFSFLIGRFTYTLDIPASDPFYKWANRLAASYPIIGGFFP
jgi:hypothetical protein